MNVTLFENNQMAYSKITMLEKAAKLLWLLPGKYKEIKHILAEKRNASINSGVVFLTKIVNFIWLFNFFKSLFHFLLNAIGLVSYSRRRLQ